MSFIYSTQLPYLSGYAVTERRVTIIYITVVTITETTKRPGIFFLSKDISSVACEIFSNPIKAQGDMTAIPSIWDMADVSFSSKGADVTFLPKAAARKQAAIPMVKVAAMMIIARLMARLRRTMRQPIRSSENMDSSASPIYTSYPNRVYSLPFLKTAPMKILANRGSDVALAQSMAR